MDWWQIAHVVARLLFSALFLKSAYSHLTKVKMMAGYAKAVGNVPAPEAATVVTGLMLLLGGLSILLGFHPRIGSALLVAFLVPTAFLMHGYWKIQDPMQRAGDEAQFWKDIALAGAALFILADPHWPWPWAIG
jgi:putative oxidoreductase